MDTTILLCVARGRRVTVGIYNIVRFSCFVHVLPMIAISQENDCPIYVFRVLPAIVLYLYLYRYKH